MNLKKICKTIKKRLNPEPPGPSSLDALSRLAELYIAKGRDKLLELENRGLQMMRFNYYSPIPSVADIENGWETRIPHPFFEPEIYHGDKMKDFLETALMPYSKEFSPRKDGDENDPNGFYWNNPSFGHCDAMALYCFIRHLKPKRILEIGGGYSTLIMDEAIRVNGMGEIWEVEPYPRPFLKRLTSITRFYEQPVQDLPLALFTELEPNDILFIDSTHTVKTSSDCTFLYLKVLKHLQKEVLIQSHDIFLPDPMPKNWNTDFQFYWTEQYLLQALLIDNNRFEVVYSSRYHCLYNKEILDKFMDQKATTIGVSLWYKRV
ncbi:MAG: hypothetical protein A2V86_15400 [Deltaproteobacteria bacterium RBG_16_49_23]|nr:MAG: hypothetical protein A2V86_15400 [Deltaproteobacteria bacterium RBG_16_49_23]